MELTQLTEKDGPVLWAFENQHRQHFESWINARPVSFYTPEGFAQALQTALLQQAADQAYHYLIWVEGELAGRINLTQIKRQHFHSATLGYRIAPAHQGHGLASEAVRSIMQKAFQMHQLQRLEATARPENPASIRVLLKNGFQQFGHSRCSLQLHRQWFDLLYFEAHAPAELLHPTA
ncbi:MAG: GNAT family N-acetyltransferase [Comamonas sp.]